jgi:large subunit ribosomal protein L21
MYAIVEIAGQQFKVEKDQQIYVHRLDALQGSKVSFDKVLLLDDNGKVDIGLPTVKGMSVTAKIVEHLKGDKVIVFKKKRRKGYKVKNGHRQYLTKIEIEKIGKSITKKQEVVEEKSAKKPAAKKPAAKKPAAKKPAAKKPAAKKPAAKKPAIKK